MQSFARHAVVVQSNTCSCKPGVRHATTHHLLSPLSRRPLTKTKNVNCSLGQHLQLQAYCRTCNYTPLAADRKKRSIAVGGDTSSYKPSVGQITAPPPTKTPGELQSGRRHPAAVMGDTCSSKSSIEHATPTPLLTPKYQLHSRVWACCCSRVCRHAVVVDTCSCKPKIGHATAPLQNTQGQLQLSVWVCNCGRGRHMQLQAYYRTCSCPLLSDKKQKASCSREGDIQLQSRVMLAIASLLFDMRLPLSQHPFTKQCEFDSGVWA